MMLKHLSIAVALCSVALCSGSATGLDRSPSEQAKQVAQAQPPAPSCGERLAESAKNPERLAALTGAVADMLDAHAQWVGTGTRDARTESDRLQALARAHRDLTARAERLAAQLRDARTLPEVEHNTRVVPAGLTRSMRRAADEARVLAQTLLQTAGEWDVRRAELEGLAPESGTGGAGTDAEPGPERDDERRLPDQLDPTLDDPGVNEPFTPDMTRPDPFDRDRGGELVRPENNPRAPPEPWHRP